MKSQTTRIWDFVPIIIKRTGAAQIISGWAQAHFPHGVSSAGRTRRSSRIRAPLVCQPIAGRVRRKIDSGNETDGAHRIGLAHTRGNYHRYNRDKSHSCAEPCRIASARYRSHCSNARRKITGRLRRRRAAVASPSLAATVCSGGL